MGEAEEAAAAKSTNASDAAREPAATEEEGTAPTASGVCGGKEMFVMIKYKMKYYIYAFPLSISEFSRDSENP